MLHMIRETNENKTSVPALEPIEVHACIQKSWYPLIQLQHRIPMAIDRGTESTRQRMGARA